jgi:cytochrome P450
MNSILPEPVNPFAPAQMSAPMMGWAKMRRDTPILRLDGGAAPIFIVTRKPDIEAIAGNTTAFSNNPVESVWRWGNDMEPEIAELFAAAGYKVVLTLQASDPPMSLQYRKIVETALNRKRIHELQAPIQARADELLAAIPEGQRVNFVDAFSVPLTLGMICLILGLPYSDADFIRGFTDDFTHMIDPSRAMPDALECAAAVVDGFKYIHGKMKYFTEHPDESLLSVIAAANTDQRPLTLEERLSMAHVLIIAGNETTRNATSSAMYVAATQPEIWARLKAEPARIPDFVEEVLRLYGPATTTPRTVLQDIEIGGVMLPKGACVFPMWASAGHDEETFGHPFEIDLDRRNKRAHLTFGMGVHHCVGSYLARAEMNIAVQSWLRDFDKVELALPASEVKFDPIFAFQAFSDLPIKVTCAAH